MLCPLCHSELSVRLSHKQVTCEIFHCLECDLISKDPGQHWNWDQQKDRYDQHNNDIENPGYVEFFEQLMRPLRPHLIGMSRSLDWGAGPGDQPVLSQLLRREGLAVDLYDPIYQPEKPSGPYDVITSTEVLEHFQNPRDSLTDILVRLRSGGIFAGLTQFHEGPEKFSDWWYVKDPTHVVFYSATTMNWIARNWDLEVLVLKSPVFIFRLASDLIPSFEGL